MYPRDFKRLFETIECSKDYTCKWLYDDFMEDIVTQGTGLLRQELELFILFGNYDTNGKKNQAGKAHILLMEGNCCCPSFAQTRQIIFF